MTAAYLASLNKAQCRAVEHGCDPTDPFPPLLIIAGAGSGKTNTLAHAAIGLDPGFTIHDREDSADLMNLVRHELGYSKTEKRFPLKGM